jgi:hypothetical protein
MEESVSKIALMELVCIGQEVAVGAVIILQLPLVMVALVAEAAVEATTTAELVGELL